MARATRDIPTPLKLSGIDEPEWSFTQKGTDGVPTAAAGLAVTVFYSRTKEFSTAAAIEASLSKACTERSGKPGTYFCAMLAADKATHLTARVGEVIYEVASVDGLAQDYQARQVVDE